MLQLSSYVADFEKKNLKIDTNIASGVGTGSVGSLTGAGNKKSNFFWFIIMLN